MNPRAERLTTPASMAAWKGRLYVFIQVAVSIMEFMPLRSSSISLPV